MIRDEKKTNQEILIPITQRKLTSMLRSFIKDPSAVLQCMVMLTFFYNLFHTVVIYTK